MRLLLWAAVLSKFRSTTLEAMNNLTPEPRPDINGKVTTRWVRSAPATVNKTLLAAPPLTPAAATQPVTRESVPLLSEVLDRGDFAGGHLFDVTAMNPLAAHRIEDCLSSAERVNPLRLDIAKAELIGVLESAREKTPSGGQAENSPLIHNFAVLGLSNGENPVYIFEGLRMFSEFSSVSDFLLDIPEESQRRAAALHKATVLAESRYLDVVIGDGDNDNRDDHDDVWSMSNPWHIKLKDEGLAHYIMDNHAHVDEIIEVIRERGADLGLIRELLENNHAPAMGSGIL